MRFQSRQLSTEFVHNHVDRRDAGVQTASAGKGLRHPARLLATAQPYRAGRRIAMQRREPPAQRALPPPVPPYIVAVRRLRPECLLR